MVLVTIKQQNTLNALQLLYGLNKEAQEVNEVSFEPLQSVFVAGQGWANLVPMRVGIQGRPWGSEYYRLEEPMSPVAPGRSG